MVKRDIRDLLAKGAKRVDIAVANLTEIAEINAQFIRGVGGTHEIRFVDSQLLHELTNMGQGGFADTDNADIGGLNQMNLGDRRQ
jgi:hypothetical protein